MTQQAGALEASDTTKPGKGLNIALWVVQGLLGLAFLMSGAMKTFTPIADLAAKGMTFAADMPGLARFIGISEMAGAIGLVLPAATRIKPGLTALAAAGLLTVMVLAAGYHFMHNDAAHAPPSIFLGALAAFVAWGRYKKAPIAPRA